MNIELAEKALALFEQYPADCHYGDIQMVGNILHFSFSGAVVHFAGARPSFPFDAQAGHSDRTSLCKMGKTSHVIRIFASELIGATDQENHFLFYLARTPAEVRMVLDLIKRDRQP